MYAGFWKRFGAWAIDAVIVVTIALTTILAISQALHATLLSEWTFERTFKETAHWLRYLFGWLYFVSFESSPWQATPGKKVLGMRVVGEDGERISWGTANLRLVMKTASALALGTGFLMIAIDARKQGLHDRVAETLVVYKA